MIRFLRRWWGEEPHGQQLEHECLNLIDAIVCADPNCYTVQRERSQLDPNKKRCRVCGKETLASLWTVVRIACDKARRTPQSRAQPTQEPQSLTEFRVKA